jgi:hypothetical protein
MKGKQMTRLVWTSFLCVLIVAWTFAQNVASTSAQNNVRRMFVYSYGDKAVAELIADSLLGEIGKGLHDQYPCVEHTSEADVRDLLKWMKLGELLGNDPDQTALENIANMIGARYVMVIVALTQPDGKISSSVKVIDRQTGQTLASGQEPSTDGESALENTIRLAKQILQDLSSVFKGRCEPYWAGTITSSIKYQSQETKSEKFPAGSGKMNTRTYVSSWRTEDVIEARLQSEGAEDLKQMKARVVHRYIHQDQHIVTEESFLWCRPRGANPFWKTVSNKESNTGDEQGETNSIETVWVNVDKSNGSYAISVKHPVLITKTHGETTATGVSCFDAKPTSKISTGEGSPESSAYREAGIVEIRGEADPKSLDILSGKKTTGNPTDGELTLTWNLRLVKPK